MRNRTFYKRNALVSLLALGLMSIATQAAPAKKKAIVKCPKCMMTMSTKKTAAKPVAIKMNGKTYYCCSACKPMSHAGHSHAGHSHAGHTHGAKKATKAAKKKVMHSSAIPDCPKCNMAMQATPSLLKKTPINVNGKTYYCCTICPKH